MCPIITPDTFIDYAIDAYINDIEIKEIKFSDDFNIHIRLRGEQWDGLIDYRIAGYIQKLQRDFIKIYNDITGKNISLRSSKEVIDPLTIKVHIEKGSTILDILVQKALDSIVSDISNPYLLSLFALTIICSFGYRGFQKYMDTKEKIEAKAKDEKTKRKLVELADTALAIAGNSATANTYLLNQLENTDTFSQSGVFQNLDKDTAKRHLTPIDFPEEVHEPITYMCDDDYSVTVFDLENQTITLKKNSITFDASTKILSEPDKKELHRIETEADLQLQIPKIELRVSCIVVGGRIDEAYVTSLGEPRKQSVPVTKIIAESSCKKLPAVQSSLLDHI